MKWASIPLLLNNMNFLVKKEKYEMLNTMFFEERCAASHKYDGTNVGIDEFGVMYGRNQTIASKTKSYQKVSLESVTKVDAKGIKG